LEYFYRVQGPVSVSDFCLQAEQLSALFGPVKSAQPREALYVAPGSDETADIGLFIDPFEMKKAEGFVLSPNGGSVDAFCVALEGVSHFLYLT
jgi:hypothetical protein